MIDMLDVRNRIGSAKLYCVTLPPAGGGYEALVEKACQGGADAVQLRDKNLSGRDLVDLGRRLKAVCRRHGTLFIVNDRLDAAVSCGADGVHLGQDDLPLADARKIVRGLGLTPSDFLIGVSTHSLDQALRAEKEGADYIGCGPVYATPTKPDYGCVGLDLVREYRKRIQIPFVAIGGIDLGNIRDVAGAGAPCVAVVRAAFAGGDILSSVKSLKDALVRPGNK